MISDPCSAYNMFIENVQEVAKKTKQICVRLRFCGKEIASIISIKYVGVRELKTGCDSYKQKSTSRCILQNNLDKVQ